jgi:hypothetical protein
MVTILLSVICALLALIAVALFYLVKVLDPILETCNTVMAIIGVQHFYGKRDWEQLARVVKSWARKNNAPKLKQQPPIDSFI